MYVNKTYKLTLGNPKEEEYLLAEFEDVKFGQLQRPLTLIKDAPPPPVADKNEEKKKKFYQKAVQRSTYLLSSGEKHLDTPKLDPKTNLQITSEPVLTMKSRRYKDDEKFAVICLEEGPNQTINVLNEKWLFTKTTTNMAPLKIKAEDTPVHQSDEKEKLKRRRKDDSEEESYSHKDDKYADDDDEFNPVHRKSQSDSHNDSESEENEHPEILEIKRQKAKQREEEDRMSRKRKYEGTIQPPEPKRTPEELKRIVHNILRKHGNEMDLEDFKNEIGPADYASLCQKESTGEVFKCTEITGEGRNTRISWKKEEPKSTRSQTHKKKQPKKK